MYENKYSKEKVLVNKVNKDMVKKEASKGNKLVLKSQKPIIKTAKVLGIYNNLQEARQDLLKK